MKVKGVPKEKHKPDLNDFGFVENSQFFWWASWYASILGYKSLSTFRNSVDKAIKVCIQLGIPFESNFLKVKTEHGVDIKLTKFACFLISLCADGRKPVVKRARAYFLNVLDELNIHLESEDYLKRRMGREEIMSLNSSLAKAAKRARVRDFRFFANEGYLGMYNHTTTELRKKRGVKRNEALADTMSMTELSANIFRVTMTEERLKHLRNPSELKAAREHWKIGSQIRSFVKENTGLYPEDLPIKMDLRLLQSNLKMAQRKLNETESKKENNRIDARKPDRPPITLL